MRVMVTAFSGNYTYLSRLWQAFSQFSIATTLIFLIRCSVSGMIRMLQCIL